MPEPVTVIILAGGYAQDLVADVETHRNSKHSPMKTTAESLKRSIMETAHTGTRAVRALMEVNSHPSILGLLVALSRSHRASPVFEHVWVVANEPDRERLAGPKSRFQQLTAESALISVPPQHIIGNGTSSPSEWQGDAADLRYALSAIEPGSPVVALSAELLCMPIFNIQRMIEHSIVRGRDTIAFDFYKPSDDSLRGKDAGPLHLLNLSESGPVPQISGLELAGAQPGDAVAAPFVVLQAETQAAIRNTTAPCLSTLMVELMGRGVPVHGIQLSFGSFRMWNAVAIDFIDRFLFFYYAKKPVNIVTAMEEVLRPDTVEHAEYVLREFERMYFGPGGHFEAMEGKSKSVPPTFYMTTYRRQTADIFH